MRIEIYIFHRHKMIKRYKEKNKIKKIRHFYNKICPDPYTCKIKTKTIKKEISSK